MADRPVSLQDLIRARQAGLFVGRTEPLRLFEQSLTLPIDDPRRRFLFSLHGPAGIGKTSLVRQWQRVAQSHDYRTAYVDEAAFDVPSAIEMLATDLNQQGARCEAFTDQLALYRKRRHEAASDPGAPSGVSSLLTRSAVRIGLRAARDIPVVGAFAGEIDKDEAARQADQARMFLARRFARQQDLELLLNPIEVLSQVFLKDLRAAAADGPIALFIDTYERTGQFLERWLLEVLEGRHGDLPPALVIAISGQDRLDPNAWGDYLGIRADIELEIFSDSEARQLLATRGVDSPQAVEIILELSGRLPVLVATLAESSADGADVINDDSDSAVDRFLRWEPDRDKQETARAGALPRRLDKDVIAVIADGPVDFDWLRRLPFVVGQTDGYRYHDVVRAPMLRSLRRSAPQDWNDHQLALADYYRTRKAALALTDRAGWKDDRWRDLFLEETYHDLCARGAAGLSDALYGLVDCYDRSRDFVARWAQMIAQAGQDAGLSAVRDRGRRLMAWLNDGTEGASALLTDLAEDNTLDDAHRGTALAERSQIHENAARYEAALADLEQACVLCPDVHWIVAWRGNAHHQLGHDDEAIRDLTRAIELDPSYSWAITSRGMVYSDLGRYDEALTDFTRAIELEADDSALEHTLRGTTFQEMNRYDEALADFTRAIELDPADAWAITCRGDAYQELSRYDEAIADFTHAIELDPEYTWAISVRGETYQAMQRYDEALADLTRAIETWHDSGWLLLTRGELYRDMERFDDAITDLTRAIELDPEYSSAIATRGGVYQDQERYDEGLADLSRAIELRPDYVWALRRRGGVYQAMKRYDDALADFTRAIELDPECDLCFAGRGDVYRELARPDDALADFTRAIELDPGYSWALGNRGQLYLDLGLLAEAEADLDRVIALVPADGWAYYLSAMVLRQRGDHEEAGNRLMHALQLDQANLAGTGDPDRIAFNVMVYFVALGDDDAARAQLRAALTSRPAVTAVDDVLADLRDLTAYANPSPVDVDLVSALEEYKTLRTASN